MYLVVDWFQGQVILGTGAVGAGLELLSAIVLEIITYVVGVLLMWQTAGRPEGAESFVLGKILVVMRRLALRDGSSSPS